MMLGLAAHGRDTQRAFRQLLVPVLLMGLTTIIGFGAPVATHQPMLKNFGMVMAVGTFTAMMTGVVVVPSFFLLGRERPYYSTMFYRARWFDVGEWLALRLNRRALHQLGRWVGSLYRLTHPRTAQALGQNLSLTQPGKVNSALVRRTFRNYGETLADYFILGTRPRAEVMALAETVGFDRVKEIVAESKGVLLVTAHLGLFEFGSLFSEAMGQAPLVVSLPEPSSALGRWRAAYRQRWGAETLEIGEDPFRFVEITRHLAKGRCVALLMDRPYGANFVSVDFPNGTAPFSTGPAWLGLLAGCPLVAVTTVRLPTGLHRIVAHPPIYAQRLNKSREETIQHYTLELAAIFRKAICEYPDQWYQFVPLSPQH
jgi:KDO2-lipid IV(A) lauroyltransferase